MNNYTSSDLVDSIYKNQLKVFSFGCGYIFDCFQILHGYRIDGIIHSNPNSIRANFPNSMEIISPDEFLEKEYADCVIVIYTKSFQNEAEIFCKNHSLKYLLYNDPAHLSRSRISKITTALQYLSSSNLISKFNLRQFSNIFDSSKNVDFVESMIENLPGHWGQYIDDICKALTKAVYWHQLCGGNGDIAEFGTASGVTSGFIAAAMAQGQNEPYLCPIRTTKLHLFDSFQGLPAISNPLDIEAGWKKGMFSGLSENELFERINRFISYDQIKIYSGWFKDTMKQIPLDVKFSLIHIDCDLYESTMDVLDHLFKYNHLLDGCMVFFDDWNCGNASPRLGERRAWSEITKKYNVNFSDSGEYSCAGHKFIIHL